MEFSSAANEMELEQQLDSQASNISALLEEVPRCDQELLSCYSIPEELENILIDIARDGEVQYEWNLVKQLIKFKTMEILDKYFKKCGFVGPVTETFDSRRDEIMRLIESYLVPPFTLQRLCEVLTDTTYKQYTSTHKLMNGIEKLLSVSSSC